MPVRTEDISRVCALFRVSTEAQEKEGFSLAAQKRAYERDCRTFGWQSVGLFEGQESGSALAQRQIVHDLIACIRSKRPDALWVIEQSRLTRGDELDVALLLRELRENGTKVVLERGTVIDPTNLEGAFMFRLKALMDRREWEVIAARNWRGKDEKARLGLLVNARPAYGYTTTGEGKGKGKRVAVPLEAAVIRKIFEWAAAGYSLYKIIQQLYDQGIPAPTQSGHHSGAIPRRFKDGLQLWGKTTIRRILKNPLYMGVSYHRCWVKKGKTYVFDRENPKAVWVDDAHEPIVTKELWEAAQQQSERRHAKRHLKIHMLTGLLTCPFCGHPYHVTTSHGRRGQSISYYCCSSKRPRSDCFGRRPRNAAACPSPWLRVDRADRVVWDAFVRLVTAPEAIEHLLASADGETKRHRLQADIVNLGQERRSIEQMLTRAREKLLTEILTDGEYLTERERLQTQLDGIERRLVQWKAELSLCSREAQLQVLHNLSLLKLGDQKLTQEQRSRLFHALVRRVIPASSDLKQVDIELYVKPAEAEAHAVLSHEQVSSPQGVVITLPLPVGAD